MQMLWHWSGEAGFIPDGGKGETRWNEPFGMVEEVSRKGAKTKAQTTFERACYP